MQPDDALNALCTRMDLRGVAQERIGKEFEKLFLKSEQPSLGIRWLARIGRLHEILPEVAALVGVEQPTAYHPEGDVFEHAMQALDAAASYTYPNQEKKLTMVIAALAHDLGKPATTRFEDGRLRAKGHDIAGVKPATSLAMRFVVPMKMVYALQKLVRYHMMPYELVKNNSSFAAYKRLASKLSPECSMYDLYMLAKADTSGRNPLEQKPFAVCPEPLVEIFLEKSQTGGVVYEPEKPLLTGADFLDCCQPGPALGALVEQAYQLQINHGVHDKDKLKKMVLKNNKSE